MARAIFSGVLNFGLVNVGVKLFTAQKDSSPSFNNLCPEGHKLVYKRWCPVCNREVSYDEIKKGFHLGKNAGYVIFDKNELEALKKQSSKLIEVIGFVDDNEINPIIFEKFYYLLPSSDVYLKQYSLLVVLLKLTHKSALAKITMRNRERLCLIKPYEKGLVLVTLHSKDDIVDFDKLMFEQNVKEAELSEEEIKLGKKLIEAMKVDFKKVFEEFRDTFKEKVVKLIKERVEGRVITIEKEPSIEAKSLQEALIQSIQVVKR